MSTRRKVTAHNSLAALVTLYAVAISHAATFAASDAGEVYELLDRVFTWQIERPSQYTTGGDGDRSWVGATFYAGVMWLYNQTGEEKYRDAMTEVGERTQWRLGNRTYVADDHCIAQTYLQLYRLHPNPQNVWIAQTRSTFNNIIAQRIPFNERSPIRNSGPHNSIWWYSWCDALFMSPPALALLSRISGDDIYADFMFEEWQFTSDMNGGWNNEHKALWNPDEGFFYRDVNYIAPKAPNGASVYWSRGNGWVIGGLCSVLEFLPDEHHSRPYFEQQLIRMIDASIDAQVHSEDVRDGLWTSSILYPAGFPEPEMSGSAFITFAIAYAINERLIPVETYSQPLMHAWQGMTAAVQESGKISWIQPVGVGPNSNTPTNATQANEQHYGYGAFLLAGTEVARFFETDFRFRPLPLIHSTETGEGQFFSQWFGTFFVPEETHPSGWIYHYDHGWSFIIGNDEDALYSYDTAFGHWLWTDANTTPWLWSAEYGWLYYAGKEPHTDFRLFWIAADALWITVEP